MATRNPARKSNSTSQPAKKAQGAATASEMGAEDESPSEATRSVDKHGPPTKSARSIARRRQPR